MDAPAAPFRRFSGHFELTSSTSRLELFLPPTPVAFITPMFTSNMKKANWIILPKRETNLG